MMYNNERIEDIQRILNNNNDLFDALRERGDFK